MKKTKKTLDRPLVKCTYLYGDRSQLQEGTMKDAIQAESKYAIAGLYLGVVCILGGLILFILGVTGATSWTAKILGAESILVDAAPGVVLFIVGLFIVYITRYKLIVRSK